MNEHHTWVRCSSDCNHAIRNAPNRLTQGPRSSLQFTRMTECMN